MIISQTPESLAEVATVISRGGVIAFRTDTFYGLGADPLNREAVQRIKELKGQEDRKPILIVISDLDQLAKFIAERSPAFDLLADEFWPGPLTLIGKASLDVPDEITAGTGTIGVRLPADDQVRALVRSCGGALTATSANKSGDAPARTAAEVADRFPSGIELIVDGGEVTATLASTVVDLSGPSPKLVREGEIKRAEIERILGALQL